MHTGWAKNRLFWWGSIILIGCCRLILLIFIVNKFFLTADRVIEAPTDQPQPPLTDGVTVNDGLDGKPARSQSEVIDWSIIPLTINQVQSPNRALDDLERFYSTIIPTNDYYITAKELGNREPGDRTIQSTDYDIGQRETFLTSDGPAEAELVFKDALATYWVQTGLNLDETEIIAAAQRFREINYPILRENIGQEWRPGVDGDDRITIIHVLGADDNSLLGYFSDQDEYPRSIFNLSNQREMIYLNMNQLTMEKSDYDGTVVHEIAHLIQWNLDANEDVWLNEGLSQIAEELIGLDPIELTSYLEATNIRIDRWGEVDSNIFAHYGGAYLYLSYFLQRTGKEALTELAHNPNNGLASIRDVLKNHLPDVTLEEFTADWATALLLDGHSSEPRFNMLAHPLSSPNFANRVRRLPFDDTATLDQFAIDFIDLDFSGQATIYFAGDTGAQLTDEPPYEGTIWFAPPADNSRSQLMTAVDLSHLSTAELAFSVWYDLEPDFDWGYLVVSSDGGATWTNMTPIGHNNRARSKMSYGPGWNGNSADSINDGNGWTEERIDLTEFVGGQLLLRFEVTTDYESLGSGFAITNLDFPQLRNQPQWEGAGFVETGHILPQQWLIRLVREGEEPEVIPIPLDDFNRGRIEVALGSEGGTLIVMPLTPFVESTAGYWLSVER